MEPETVSLIVGTTSSVVAIVAIAANVWLTRVNLREQRLRETGQRLWTKRADLYVEVLKLIHEAWDDPEYKNSPRAYEYYERQWDRLFPQMLAFGSPEATVAARDFFAKPSYADYGTRFQELIGEELQGRSALPSSPWGAGPVGSEEPGSSPNRNKLLQWLQRHQRKRPVKRSH